jgi:GntR family transcriptional regulator, arabinose operon transcriptional repressor
LTEPQKPKYQQIVTDLQKAITSGEYKEGQRLPSEADLTKRFSTSRLTVQRALKELQHQALIERRAGSGTYVRRNERSDRYVFGLLIPGLGETEIFEPICQGMARAGRAGGHALLWGDTTHASSDCESDHEQRTRELCEYYLDRRVTGIFFAPLELTQSMDCVNQWVVDTLTEARIPVVLLDRDIYRYPRRCGFDLVGIDNRRAGFLMTEHLLRHGCKRALFLGRPLSAYTVDSRIAGFQDALQAFQVANVHGQVHIGDPDDVDPLRSIFQHFRPDGIVCANDLTAARLMRTLDRIGLQVPRDLRIVAIDDVKYAGLLGVPLTTLHQPCREIGETAVRTMLERIAHPGLPPRDVLLECKLMVRRSCGTHRAEDN